MSRKRKAPKKIPIVDPKFKSAVIPKLINSIMYDGKKTIAEKIIYDAIDKIKSKTKDEPIEIFNQAINNSEPHHLADYLYEISNLFNSMYQNVNILDNQNKVVKNNKLIISQYFIEYSEFLMDLLGLEPVEQM